MLVVNVKTILQSLVLLVWLLPVSMVEAQVKVESVQTSFEPAITASGVPRRSFLEASLQFDLRGQGMVRARWMILLPNEPETPHLLQAIRLSINKDARRTIASPPLPTAEIGQYYLRLIIDEPFATPSVDDVGYVVE